MGLKIFLFLLNLHAIFCQNEIMQCTYSKINTGGYSCALKIINPNGLNNFQKIDGSHMNGMTNDDVIRVETSTNSNTSNIPSAVCDTFKNTNIFYMYGGSVAKIEENSFSSCKNLTSLTCYSNIFTAIPEKALLENTELTYVGLLRNLISSLPENLFINLKKLDTLYLQENRLTDLPRNIFRPLKQLRILDFGYNYIPSLRHEWFETLENLQELRIGGNKFETLPNGIFNQLKNIFTIYLQDNRLTIINSKSFGSLPTLEQIIFSRNQISAIDEKFVDDTGVVFIQMNGNVCSNEQMISDRSDPTKMTMRRYLKKCFENFEFLIRDCPIGNLDQRVCKLEENTEQVDENYRYLYRQIAELKDENMRMQPIVYEIQKYLEKFRVLEEKFQTIVSAVDRLLKQVFN